MRALVCDGPGTPVLRDVPVPRPGPGEVLVRVGAALTCGTDLKIARRGHSKFPFPLTLGHEWAGVVEEAGAGAAWARGTRVTSAVSAPCGACAACLAGRENLCETAFDRSLFGAFAEFLLVPARLARNALRRIPDGMADETAALLDPLASVVRGLGRVPARGQDVLVVGTGPIAAMMFFLLRGKETEEKGGAAGRRIVVAGRRPGRLAFFERRMEEVARISSEVRVGSTPGHAPFSFEGDPDASGGIDPSPHPGGAGAPPPVFTFKEKLSSSLSPSSSSSSSFFPLVIDTTGDPGVIAALPALAADGGTVLLFAGLPAGAHVAIEAHAVHYREVSIVGSFHYTPREVDEALAVLASGAIPAAEIVSERRPLAEWQEAFDLAREGTALKVAVIP